MSDIETLAAKLREAEETNRRLQARLKEVEAERDKYGETAFYAPYTQERKTVAQWCKETDEFEEQIRTGQTVPFDSILSEVEELIRSFEREDLAKAAATAREPAA
jgi:hypothetical protein